MYLDTLTTMLTPFYTLQVDTVIMVCASMSQALDDRPAEARSFRKILSLHNGVSTIGRERSGALFEPSVAADSSTLCR